MLSPFVISESDELCDKVASGRLIPAAMIAPPIRTCRRDISGISFVLGSEGFTLSIGRIWIWPPSFDENSIGGSGSLFSSVLAGISFLTPRMVPIVHPFPLLPSPDIPQNHLFHILQDRFVRLETPSILVVFGAPKRMPRV